jgi:hypothetical protein
MNLIYPLISPHCAMELEVPRMPREVLMPQCYAVPFVPEEFHRIAHKKIALPPGLNWKALLAS